MVPSAFRGYVPARYPALRYGLALNDRGYFWEAQEVLEAVWAAAPQGGRERICCAPASRSPMPICDCGCSARRPRGCSGTRSESCGL
ncbi:DUF309 domain-containing protein [Bradyrhizobium betae]